LPALTCPKRRGAQGPPAFLLSAASAAYNPSPMSYLTLPTQLAVVRERIAAACDRAGRRVEEVTIVAVTKTHPSAAIEAVRDAGLMDVGENRIQELEEKVDEIGRAGVRWHLIGHLQRNKARRAVELVDFIHSIDSLRIAQKLSEEAVARGKVLDGLVQVNILGEETKGGFARDSAVNAIGQVCALPGLRIRGIMTMAPFTDDEGTLRAVFGGARRLLEEAAAAHESFEPAHLSMGMSGDYEIAVEEGSTLVRLGTVLLGARTP
jgi:PLP dependent protein